VAAVADAGDIADMAVRSRAARAAAESCAWDRDLDELIGAF
jgi:hypothetical protein